MTVKPAGLHDRRPIAVLPVERYIARRVPPDCWRILRHCALHVWRRGERIELDLNRFGRVARLIRRLGDHDGDRFTHVPHALRGQYWHCGLEHRLTVAAIEGSNRRDVADAVRREILARDCGDDARHLHRRRGVHLANDGMGDGRPHERSVGLTSDVQIVGELSAAGEEGRVLATDGAMSATEPKACTVSLLRFVSLRAHGYHRSSREYRTHFIVSICNTCSTPMQIGARGHSASADSIWHPPNPC